MTNRERENKTLSFDTYYGRGSVEETFYPWDATVAEWLEQGLDSRFATLGGRVNFSKADAEPVDACRLYFDDIMTDAENDFSTSLGFDSVKRLSLQYPWREIGVRVAELSDWKRLLEQCQAVLQEHYTKENVQKVYKKYQEGQEHGDYSIRFCVGGFFWTPRELIGIEEHMYALYDAPELIHAINRWQLEFYKTYLAEIFRYVKPDVFYIMEDLSGKNGPMLGPAHFEEYIGDYYRELVPFLKQRGVKYVFTDTDGDFQKLIPNFIDAGIDGFLPMDVNAGMDIVAVRESYPKLRFIGAFNKLEIAKGPEAIDAEFERLLPVIRQGGYIPGSDHQVAPGTRLEDYRYYIKRLFEVMEQAGADCRKQSGTD